jgi:SWI/SNF-related matrix-associated actin-dependent regulator of chromatin subfamily A member 5
MLRRTKAEAIADLPPKKEIHLFVGLTDKQIEMY